MNCVLPACPASFGMEVMILVGVERLPELPLGAAMTMVLVPTWVVVTELPGLAMDSMEEGMVLIRVVTVRDTPICRDMGFHYQSVNCAGHNKVNHLQGETYVHWF